MKFAVIAKHRGVWQTREMCEALGVSRGGFYEWLKEGKQKLPQQVQSADNEGLLLAGIWERWRRGEPVFDPAVDREVSP